MCQDRIGLELLPDAAAAEEACAVAIDVEGRLTLVPDPQEDGFGPPRGLLALELGVEPSAMTGSAAAGSAIPSASRSPSKSPGR